ncbi:MAG: hypothetical protein M1484_03405 [Patescibacteria group bacterium]|nr:hypothetical protein [Patescibacteria group bacterium]MCL5432109.1 hypothetical protein [Patescibacteria group bacterium]
MTNFQKGLIFGTVILLVLAAASGGWLLTRNRVAGPIQKPMVPITVTAWKTYFNRDFSFQYPADWQIATSEAKISADSAPMKIETVSNAVLSGNTPPEGETVTIQQISLTDVQFPPTMFNQAAKIKLGGQEIQTYATKNNGASTNYLRFIYKGTSKNNYLFSFDYYNGQHPNRDYPKLSDQIIKSFVARP